MINYSELWIGDQVYIKSMKRNGHWEGLHGPDKAKIKIDNKSILVPLSEIEKAIEIEEEEDFSLPEEVKTQELLKNNEIDLHIEKLNPSLANASPQLILNHQIKNCKIFIEKAIQAKKNQILIIHGVGEGVLKSEVEHLIRDYEEVNFTFPKNQGGATEVWFQY